MPIVGMASMAGSNRPRVRPDLDVGVAQLVGHDTEALGLVVLAPERLDDQCRLEALVGDLGDVGAQLLGTGHTRRHGALEGDVGQEEHREDGEPDEGEPWVDDDHLDDAEDEHDDDTEGHRQRREDVPRRLDVGVRVGEQLTRRVLVVPAEREPEVLSRDLAAVHRTEVVHRDATGDAATDDADDRRQHDGRHDAADEPQLGGRHVPGLDGRGDGPLDDEADRGCREARHDAVDDAPEHGDGEPARLALDAPADDGETLSEGRGGRDVHGVLLPW